MMYSFFKQIEILRFTTFFVVFLTLLYGCTPQVTRVNVNRNTDLSGNWNDTDSRLVSKAMIKSILNSQWLKDFLYRNGRKPRIIMGSFANRSYEHIPVRAFIKDLENELIASGEVSFVASKAIRREIRRERAEFQESNTDPAGTRIIPEKKADYVLTGVIQSMIDQVENDKVVFYQVDMELINLNTNEKVWGGQKKIKKRVRKAKVAW